MDKALEVLHLDSPDSLKRFVVMVLGVLTLVLVNPLLAKAGIPPVSDSTIQAVAGAIVAYLLQSGLNSAAAARAAGVVEAAKIKSLDEAQAELGAVPAKLGNK